MLIAHYIGNHAQDAPYVRAGWALTRLAQKGPYGIVTHCEAILHDWGRGRADIGSSSLRDGGVRIKESVALDPASWWIADVPQWDAERAQEWFIANDSAPYDWRGALATVLPGHSSNGYFCNEAVAASVGLKTPQCFTPSQFAAICFSLGRDVTAQFFSTTTP